MPMTRLRGQGTRQAGEGACSGNCFPCAFLFLDSMVGIGTDCAEARVPKGTSTQGPQHLAARDWSAYGVGKEADGFFQKEAAYHW
jgi:hypothetical protein